MAILRLLRRVNVLLTRKQHLPSLLLPLQRPQCLSPPHRLCRYHGHDHHFNSFFPPIFYIFQCTPRWYFIYLAGITSMGIFTIITLFTPSLSSPKYRGFRALLFASMGLFGIVPAVHALVVNWNNPQRNLTLVYELAMAVFYLVGTGFYVGRVPERLKPGWFDRVGHSHQIFHVFIVFGALSHYAAALLFLDWRDHVGC